MCKFKCSRFMRLFGRVHGFPLIKCNDIEDLVLSRAVLGDVLHTNGPKPRN